MKAEWTNKDSLSIESTGKKSILVIDTPQNCKECYLSFEHPEHGLWCLCLTEKEEYSSILPVNPCSIDERCPIKPLPKKKTPNGSDIFNDYVRGWNECVDEILGETE